MKRIGGVILIVIGVNAIRDAMQGIDGSVLASVAIFVIGSVSLCCGLELYSGRAK